MSSTFSRPIKSLFGMTGAMLVVSASASFAQDAPTWADLGPFFGERCTLCHSGPGAPLGLHLDSYQGAVKGSQNGPVLVPGDPDGSELIRRARRISQRQMPLVGPWFSSVPQDRPSHSSLQRNGAAISIHEHRGPDRLLLGPGHRPKGRLRGGRDVPSRVLLVRVIDRLEAL